MITKDLIPYSGTKAFAIMETGRYRREGDYGGRRVDAAP